MARGGKKIDRSTLPAALTRRRPSVPAFAAETGTVEIETLLPAAPAVEIEIEKPDEAVPDVLLEQMRAEAARAEAKQAVAQEVVVEAQEVAVEAPEAAAPVVAEKTEEAPVVAATLQAQRDALCIEKARAQKAMEQEMLEFHEAVAKANAAAEYYKDATAKAEARRLYQEEQLRLLEQAETERRAVLDAKQETAGGKETETETERQAPTAPLPARKRNVSTRSRDYHQQATVPAVASEAPGHDPATTAQEPEYACAPANAEAYAKMQSDGPSIQFTTHRLTETEIAAEGHLANETPAERWRRNNPRTVLSTMTMPDPVTIAQFKKQNWVLVSYVEPSTFAALHYGDNASYHGFCMKVRGVFEHKREARQLAELLLAIEPEYAIHLIPSFCWTPVNDQMCVTKEFDEWLVEETCERYIEASEANKQKVQRRIAETAKHLGDMAFDADKMHIPREDRNAESTTFFAKLQHEKSHPEEYETPALPKETTDDIYFEPAGVIEHCDEKQVENIFLDVSGCNAGKNADAPVQLVLDSDDPLPTQNYIVMSWLLPEEYGAPVYMNEDKSLAFSGIVVKPRGVFEHEADARAHCEKLSQQGNQDIDVHVLAVGSWTPLKDVDVSDRQYTDEKLQELMDGYRENKASQAGSTRSRMARAVLVNNAPVIFTDDGQLDTSAHLRHQAEYKKKQAMRAELERSIGADAFKVGGKKSNRITHSFDERGIF